jgi:hypothetical protein
MQPNQDFLSRIVQAQIKLGMKVFINPGELNIVYVEGCDFSGTPNKDTMNEWNDIRLVYRIDKNSPKLLGAWKATTEPGWKYTASPLNPAGAFRIAFGQYKAWQVGWHKNHEALVQVENVKGYRDRNKDGFRTGDLPVTGLFGINQHWGYDMPQVDGASAGCLVGQSKSGHLEFMGIIKSDIRYLSDNKYIFWTSVLDGSKI